MAHPVETELLEGTFAVKFWANSSGRSRLSQARCDVPGNRAAKDVCWETPNAAHHQETWRVTWRGKRIANAEEVALQRAAAEDRVLRSSRVEWV